MLIARLLQVDLLGCCRNRLATETIEQYLVAFYLLCMSPSIAAIVSGLVALRRERLAFLDPGLFVVTLLAALVTSFLPGLPDGGLVWSFVIFVCMGLLGAPVYGAAMLYLEAKRDYHLARAQGRRPGEIAAVLGILLGWLDSATTGIFVLILAFQTDIAPTLFIFGFMNGLLLLRLFVSYELGPLLAEGFSHLARRQQTRGQ